MKKGIKEFYASVLHPLDSKKLLKCKHCKISYSGKDYGILFRAKKIIYFDFAASPTLAVKLCNHCFIQFISYTCLKYGMPSAKVMIMDGKKERVFEFSPFVDRLLIEDMIRHHMKSSKQKS